MPTFKNGSIILSINRLEVFEMTAESQTVNPSEDSTIREGDLIQIEMDGWIVESGKLFMTTDKERAQKEGIYNEKEIYQPIFEIVGSKRFFPGLENSILKAKVGEEVEVELKPEEAAGPRDPAQVKLYSIRELERNDVEPRVGADVVIGNRVGRITQATAGRVRIDFNNPLAGHMLRYRYKVLRKITDPIEKVKAFIEMHYGNSSGFGVNIEGKKLTMTLPETAKLDQKWISAKLLVVADAFKYAGMDEVEFIEKYSRPQERTEKKGEGEQKTEEKEEKQAPDSEIKTE
jgi:FKBP-type peptidyl-prolyl cis-trans isomerase 2